MLPESPTKFEMQVRSRNNNNGEGKVVSFSSKDDTETEDVVAVAEVEADDSGDVHSDYAQQQIHDIDPTLTEFGGEDESFAEVKIRETKLLKLSGTEQLGGGDITKIIDGSRRISTGTTATCTEDSRSTDGGDSGNIKFASPPSRRKTFSAGNNDFRKNIAIAVKNHERNKVKTRIILKKESPVMKPDESKRSRSPTRSRSPIRSFSPIRRRAQSVGPTSDLKRITSMIQNEEENGRSTKQEQKKMNDLSNKTLPHSPDSKRKLNVGLSWAFRKSAARVLDEHIKSCEMTKDDINDIVVDESSFPPDLPRIIYVFKSVKKESSVIRESPNKKKQNSFVQRITNSMRSNRSKLHLEEDDPETYEQTLVDL